jgi:hypothetical protein
MNQNPEQKAGTILTVNWRHAAGTFRTSRKSICLPAAASRCVSIRPAPARPITFCLTNHGTFLEQYHLEADPGKLLIVASVGFGEKTQLAADVKKIGGKHAA